MWKRHTKQELKPGLENDWCFILSYSNANTTNKKNSVCSCPVYFVSKSSEVFIGDQFALLQNCNTDINTVKGQLEVRLLLMSCS